MHIDDPDCADYTRPRNFDAAKLKAEAEAIVLPNELAACLLLWRNIVKMPAGTYAQKFRKRLFKDRVYPHLVKLQQASTVIQTDGGIRVPVTDEPDDLPSVQAFVLSTQAERSDIEPAERAFCASKPGLFSRVRKLFPVYW